MVDHNTIANGSSLTVLFCIVWLGVFLVYKTDKHFATNVRKAKLFNDAGLAMICKTVSGVVIDWNKEAEALFGFSAKEAIGKSIYDLIVPQRFHNEETQLLERIEQGEWVTIVNTKRKKNNGQEFDVRIIVSPILDDRGAHIGVLSTIRDTSLEVQSDSEKIKVQNRLDQTISLIGMAIWELHVDTNMVEWDETFALLYGQNVSSFVPSYANWKITLHPDDRNKTELILRNALHERSGYNATFRICKPDGEIRYIRSKGAMSYDDAGKPTSILAVNYDVTDEKLREEQIDALNISLEKIVEARTTELREVSSVQRSILASAELAIIAMHIDGTISVFNPAAERMLGYSSDEVIGKQTALAFHDYSEIEVKANELSDVLNQSIVPGMDVLIAIAMHNTFNGNRWTYVRKDKTQFPGALTVSSLRDDEGSLFGYLAMVQDQSEQVKKDEALRANQALLQNITDNLPSLIGYFDKNRICKFANAFYKLWFGYEPTEIVGSHMSNILPEKLYAANEPYIAQVLAGDEQHFERTMVRVDGETRYTRAHYIPDIRNGVVKGIYVLVSDITDLKQAEVDLANLNAALEQRTIEAEAATSLKSQFLANMSHEIRSPMNGILGMLQLLQRSDLNSLQLDYANKAFRATKSLLHLLNDVLDFSKIEAGKIELESVSFDSNDMIDDVLNVLHANLDKKNVTIRATVDKLVPPILFGDVFRIKQVLLNLGINAIKFTKEGEIGIDIKVVDDLGYGCIVEFSVQDSGIGIAKENLKSIFDGFSQAEASTSRRFGGTGLGLSISHKLVSLLGGDFEVKSELGKGSRFSFTLPFTFVNDHDAANKITPEPRSISGKRILIIEEDQFVKSSLVKCVNELELGCEAVSTIFEALLHARDTPSYAYDFIIVDSNANIDELHELIESENSNCLQQARIVASAALASHRPLTASTVLDALLDVQGEESNTQPLEHIRLLVVDDNELNREIADSLFSLEGATVELAASGEEALQLLADPAHVYDAMLLDIQMPVMDGFEVTRIVRSMEQFKKFPILAMTANAMEFERQACLDAGMSDHIAKPIDLDIAIETIRRFTRLAKPEFQMSGRG